MKHTNALIIDLFSEENLLAIEEANTDRVVSLFHFAGPAKGIDEYPESYASLRVSCTKNSIDDELVDIAA